MNNSLQKHILATYLDMRIGLGVLGLLFPVLLWVCGLIFPGAELRLQPSISAYYHTPLRNLFVGFLFITGAFLYLYRGFSKAENWLLNGAGVLAVCVALFPTRIICDPGDALCLERAATAYTNPWVHGTSAIVFFLLIAVACLTQSRHTVKEIRDGRRQARYRRIYRVIGGAMIVLPLLAFAFSFALEGDLPPTEQHWTYRAEFAAIWVFAIYWIVKGREIRETQADQNAASGSLKDAPVATV